jgi:hypothetical protein
LQPQVNVVSLDRRAHGGFVAASHEQGVDVGRQVLQRPRAGQAQAAVGPQRATGRRGHVHAVAAWALLVGFAEHAGRARNVERLHAMKRHQHNGLGRKRGFFVLVGRDGGT